MRGLGRAGPSRQDAAPYPPKYDCQSYLAGFDSHNEEDRASIERDSSVEGTASLSLSGSAPSI